MIRKGFRPIVSSIKNGLLFKNSQNKHQNNFIKHINQCSYFGFTKKISYGFSQQKTNDPNA